MPNRTKIVGPIDRRSFALGLLIAASGLCFASPVAALTSAEAKQLIGKLVDDLNNIINSGKPRSALYRDFEKLFNKYGDVPIIARSSLGIAWKSASSSQRTRYVKAFSGYMSRKWGKRFEEFRGGTIEVTGAKKVKSNYLVSSIANLPGQAPFAVDWQVSDKSGKNLMFNLFIEGISLLATERTEIAAMLDNRKGDIEKLIAHLKTAS